MSSQDTRPRDDGHVDMPYGVLPPPDIVEYLVGQHMLIRDLAAEVVLSTGHQRREAFRELVRLLSVHETAEEEVVHPAARRAVADGDLVVGDRLQEEREAKELLRRLDGMDVDAPEFLPQFQRLRTAVVSHALYEQRYEFSRMRQHLPTVVRASMRTLAKAAEAGAPTHPHPGVESATANALVGPVAAIVDRARDAIRAARGGSEE
jgi:hypothetical protein